MKAQRPFIVIAGSAAPTTSEEAVAAAHQFVNLLVSEGLSKGYGFVVAFTNEPIHPNDENLALTFDATVIRAIAKLAEAGTSKLRGRLQLVVNLDKWTSAYLEMGDSLTSSGDRDRETFRIAKRLVNEGIATVVTIPDERWVGGRIREQQAALADAMVSIGGGKGVLDLRGLLKEKSAPVLPIKSGFAGILNDAEADRLLVPEFRNHPDHFIQVSPRPCALHRAELAAIVEPCRLVNRSLI